MWSRTPFSHRPPLQREMPPTDHCKALRKRYFGHRALRGEDCLPCLTRSTIHGKHIDPIKENHTQYNFQRSEFKSASMDSGPAPLIILVTEGGLLAQGASNHHSLTNTCRNHPKGGMRTPPSITPTHTLTGNGAMLQGTDRTAHSTLRHADVYLQVPIPKSHLFTSPKLAKLCTKRMYFVSLSLFF